MRKKPRERVLKPRWRKSRLEELVCQAVVDCHDEEEQQLGFFNALEEHLAFPFKTEILGMQVSVRRLDVNEADEIVAVCEREGESQNIPLLDLPLPKPAHKGAEWIEAYRLWMSE